MMARALLFLVLSCILYSCSDARDEKFFKVPIDPAIRMQDRPARLVDDTSNPQMVKLRQIQDQIFGIINEETNSDFQGVSQLLQMVDSEAGKEVGKLAMNAAMIALGTGKSYQLYEEFLDDFKYRGPLGLSEAFHDYADFMKGVDISMIPLTMEVLFKKDHLGNSLAQMPLGQLVDLVQPEASKYGIDIRGMIDGILGKGESKFPELLRKAMYNFNMTNIMNTVLGSVGESTGEEILKVQDHRADKNVGKLFKPMIANLLKQNNIDLEPDAVVQVLNPFINALGNVANNPQQIAPLLAGITGLMSSGGGLDLPSIMNLAGQLMGKSPKGKNSKTKEEPDIMNLLGSVLGGSTGQLDPQVLLSTASQLMGQNSGGLDLSNVLNMFDSKNGGLDTAKLLGSAMDMLNSGNKPQKAPKQNKPQTKRKDVPKRESDLIDILESSIKTMRTDQTMKSKINEGWTFFKSLLKAKNINLEEMDSLIPSLLLMATGGTSVPGGINTDILSAMLTSSEDDWKETLNNLDNADLRETVVHSAIGPATQVLQMLTHEAFIKQAYANMHSKIQEGLQSFGIMGVTIDNFPDKLVMPIGMLLVPFNIKMDIRSQLVSARKSLKDLKQWIDASISALQKIPKHKMESEVAKALDKDVLSPLVSVWKSYEETIQSPKCFIRNMCEKLAEIQDDSNHTNLHKLMTRTFALGLGIGRSYKAENMDLALGVLKVSFRSQHHCEVDFPYDCPRTTEGTPVGSQGGMNLQYDDLKDEL